ncbi:MAG: helix-turn-helix domain-containing protein [Deltaproteobacteria bacterium]|nr:helix-turn-helix domain-containing protein [Deltaproteobacteria bacterium]
METNPKKQRQHCYRDYASGQWSMSELCGRYQISRPTGYKWGDRIEAEGLKAVDDRSRAPNRHPNRTPEHVARETLLLREKYGGGATKLHQILKRRHPSRNLPGPEYGQRNPGSTRPSSKESAQAGLEASRRRALGDSGAERAVVKPLWISLEIAEKG